MSWLRRRWWVFAIVLGLVGLAALFNYLVFPVGSKTPSEAVLEEIEEQADGGSARILIEEPWGDGELVLAHYESGGEGHLGLGFAIRRGRGWKVTAYTEQPAEPDDVTVGSLLVATSRGGSGQPAWSAAVGQLSDERVTSVEVRWEDGTTTSAERRNDAYLVVEDGDEPAELARYLGDDGKEIAKVPARTE